MPKYIPGPWLAYKPYGKLFIRGGGRVIAEVAPDTDAGDANANLMAAAPELLSMLKQALYEYSYVVNKDNECECGEYELNKTCWHSQATALIGKAEGRY